MKQLKKVKVLMLPTEKASSLYIETMGELVFGEYALPDKGKENTNQHLYLVSDEEIKEGDWCLLFDDYGNLMSRPQQYLGKNAGHTLNSGLRKVIATTDRSLGEQLSKDKETALDRLKAKHSIPEIPESFIRAYVEANGEIDEVMVEYHPNKWVKDGISRPVLDDGVVKDYKGDWEYSVKTRDDNTVIIHRLE